MAQRASGKKKKRKQRPVAAQPRPSRSEAKNAAVRETLEPLAPGERPTAVTVGAIVAVALVVVNVALFFAWDGDERPAPVSFAFFIVLMLVMAWGMWKARYWAVLAFQALLALVILGFSLFALRFEDALDLLIALAVIVPASALFWFMVKAMARIQMPERPGT